jgi:hypothetical protein
MSVCAATIWSNRYTRPIGTAAGPGIVRVPAVKDPAHAPHQRGDLLPDPELLAGALGDDPGCLDARHPGEGDAAPAITGVTTRGAPRPGSGWAWIPAPEVGAASERGARLP